jgi:hypothetical protein
MTAEAYPGRATDPCSGSAEAGDVANAEDDDKEEEGYVVVALGEEPESRRRLLPEAPVPPAAPRCQELPPVTESKAASAMRGTLSRSRLKASSPRRLAKFCSI